MPRRDDESIARKAGEIMDQTKSSSSSDLTASAIAERQAEAKEIAESLTGKRTAASADHSRYSPVTVSREHSSGESSPVAEFVGFLKQTKRVWLMAVGTMVGLIVLTYQMSGNETYIFDFSRTAEENSDWVFLSMKDAKGKSYETAEEKVGAMSCLNSGK